MTDSPMTGVTTSDAAVGPSDLDGPFALLVATSRLLTAKYPKGRGPFERVVRLTEETGEVAEQVNIWAGTGLKRHKHGDFNPQYLAVEISDVMRAAVGIALEFDILDLVYDEIRDRHARTVDEPATQ